MVKLPGFIKFYMPSLGQENLKIPSWFIQSIQGKWPENVALRDRYNNMWQVKVEMAGGYWYFKDGWAKFTEDNMIKGGDLLVYEYLSQGILDFKVHDQTTCSTKGVGGHKSKNTNEPSIKIEPDNDIADHPRVEKMFADDYHCVPATEGGNARFNLFEVEEVTDDDTDDDDCHATEDENDYREGNNVIDDKIEKWIVKHKKMTKKRTREDGPSNGNASSSKKKSTRDDWRGVEVFQSGLVQQPSNPYFVTKKRKSRAGELYVPVDMIRLYDLKLQDKILLIDPKERQFRATRKTWSDGRTLYTGGWKSLCGMNLVGDEDTLICEFVQKGCDLCIRVRIVPPTGHQP